jgi:hypothetical protein
LCLIEFKLPAATCVLAYASSRLHPPQNPGRSFTRSFGGRVGALLGLRFLWKTLETLLLLLPVTFLKALLLLQRACCLGCKVLQAPAAAHSFTMRHS